MAKLRALPEFPDVLVAILCVWRTRSSTSPPLVSFPDPHVRPPERGSGIGFLGIAESACSKNGQANQNAGFETVMWLQCVLERRSVPIPIAKCIRSHWNRPIRPKHITIVLNYVKLHRADSAMPRNPAKDSRPSFGRAHVRPRVWERDYPTSSSAARASGRSRTRYI